MNIGWILLIAAISIVALFVIVSRRGKTTVMHGTPSTSTSRWVGQGGSRFVGGGSRLVATQPRRDDSDGVVDAMLLTAALTDDGGYEVEPVVPVEDPIYVEPVEPVREPEVPQPTPAPEVPATPAPEPEPYRAPVPETRYEPTPSYDNDTSRGSDSYSSDSGGSSDGGGGGGD